MAKKRPTICLNHQTVGNLKAYLDRFPDDAKVVISGIGPNYDDVDCQIACNVEHQEQENVVQFILGMPASMMETQQPLGEPQQTRTDPKDQNAATDLAEPEDRTHRAQAEEHTRRQNVNPEPDALRLTDPNQ